MGLAIERVKDITDLADRVVGGLGEGVVRVYGLGDVVVGVILELRVQGFRCSISLGAGNGQRELISIGVIGEVADIAQGVRCRRKPRL
jgi:hypothetical protein